MAMTTMSAEAPGTLGRRWRHLSPAGRGVTVVVILVISVNLLLSGLRAVNGGEPSGPASSSYATAPDGLSAWASLLAGHGHPVRRLRQPLDKANLDPGATLVVADPDLLDDREIRAVERFVRAGGRLVASGPFTMALVRRLVSGLVLGPGGPQRATPLVPVPEVREVVVVRSDGAAQFAKAGPAVPLLAGAATQVGPTGRPGPSRVAVLAAVADVGSGRLVALADTSPLQNRRLDQADNAAFALSIVGPGRRPVRFAETSHGYGDNGLLPLDALPGRWPAALIAGAAAAAVWAWSRGRRFGPPEGTEQPPPPPRRAYVDALAANLARTGHPDDAVAPLRRHARRRLAARVGLPVDASESALREAAIRAGTPPESADAVLGSVGDDDGLLALGRAVAHLEERR
jgi:uncharacterized protein DUF4350